MPRSSPLVLRDGEIADPLPAQINHPPWKVLARNTRNGQRLSKNMWSYQKAKKLRARKAEELGEDWDVVVVSRCVGYGPPYSKVPDLMLLERNESLQWWCPYCRRFTEFLWQPRDELKHCQHCRISEQDFHVIRCNPVLWDTDNLRALLGER